LTAPTLGIIEGFFGPMWSWPARESVVRMLAPSGYTRYVYAPKGDAALRRAWDAPYEDAWLEQLAAFATFCAESRVEFGVGISPYGLQNDAGLEKLANFRERIRILASTGIKHFSILFDDMEAGVEDLAGAQLRIVDAAANASPEAKFIVCPSYYSDDIVLDRVFGERPKNYLEDLGRNLDSTIEVFWTGPEVCARQISVTHVQRIGETLRRKPTLWDNYPVNDGPRMSTQLHLRGFTGRDASIGEHIAAHLINPALQPTLSTIPALTLADVYTRESRYDYAESFYEAAQRVAGSALAQALREDLLAMQDAGLHRLGEKAQALRAKYAAFDHDVAREVIAWLNGDYAVSAEIVQTQ
jgi:hyaluronoglucosaminidase